MRILFSIVSGHLTSDIQNIQFHRAQELDLPEEEIHEDMSWVVLETTDTLVSNTVVSETLRRHEFPA